MKASGRSGATLPGMPTAIGDPGVFVCSIGDGGPIEPERAAPAPAPPPRSGVWLVINSCPHCTPRTRTYCADHARDNWWLRVFGPKWKR